MKKMKRGIYVALAAVLLLTAVLVISCPELLTPDGLKLDGNQPGGFVPPGKDKPQGGSQPEDLVLTEDMGYILLNIQNSIYGARTLLPVTTGITLASFDSIEIEIINASSVSVYSKLWDKTGAGHNYADILTTPIPLVAGAYTVEVTAFADTYVNPAAPDPDDLLTHVPRAFGDANATISAIAGDDVTITLKEIVDGTGYGTFTWNLTMPATPDPDDPGVAPDIPFVYDTASMAITVIGGGAVAPAGSPYNLLAGGNVNAGISLNSGYYRVVITIEKARHQTIYLRETLHIYENFTTNFTNATFLPVLRRNSYDVSYHFDDTRTTDPEVSAVAHGFDLGGANAGMAVLEPSPAPTHFGNSTRYVFDEWVTSYGGTTTFPFPITTAQMIRDYDIYAKWTDLASQSLEFTAVNIGYTTPNDPVLTGNPISYDRLTGSIAVTITVTNATDFSSITWYRDDVLAPIATQTPGAGFGTIVLNFNSELLLKQLGYYTIQVEAVDDDSSNTYTTTARINVIDTP